MAHGSGQAPAIARIIPAINSRPANYAKSKHWQRCAMPRFSVQAGNGEPGGLMAGGVQGVPPCFHGRLKTR